MDDGIVEFRPPINSLKSSFHSPFHPAFTKEIFHKLASRSKSKMNPTKKTHQNLQLLDYSRSETVTLE